MGNTPQTMRGKKVDARPAFEALHDFADTNGTSAEFALAECTLGTRICMERTADECRLLCENDKYREMADEHAERIAKLAVTYSTVDKKAFDIMEKNKETAKTVGRHIKCMMSAITNGLEDEDSTVPTADLKKDLDEIIKSVQNMEASTTQLGDIAKIMAAEVALEQEQIQESVEKIRNMVGCDKEKEGAREKGFLLCVLAAPMTGGMSLLGAGAFLAGAEVASRDGTQGERSGNYLMNMHENLENVIAGLGGRCEEYVRITKALKVLKDSLDRGAKIQIHDFEDLQAVANKTAGNLDAIADSYDGILGQTDDKNRLKALHDDGKYRQIHLKDDVSTTASSASSSRASRSTSPGSSTETPSIVIEEVNTKSDGKGNRKEKPSTVVIEEVK